jgi:hypothetical protein
LLERYGYQIETTDENGDIVLTENLCDVQDAAAAGTLHAPSPACGPVQQQLLSFLKCGRCGGGGWWWLVVEQKWSRTTT